MKLSIDNREIEVPAGTTVLTAAQANDIYIPALCYHPELTPYGGCRLCMVEIEGMRGYPTACTTQVSEGMIVRTQSKRLQEMRCEMLQLILSEHPGSCLICDERRDCSEYMTTIRKVGMTTGCRWCPKDQDCELQKVVDYLELEEITFPVYYRGFEPEKYDPFYDRDYNLCIYCGRCVRICDEYRKSSVIALNQRGRSTTISPAFGVSHVEGDCEFCGACITVCPTGTLSEKRRKWEGLPTSCLPAVCAFCGTHCDIQYALKEERLIGTLPPGDAHQTGGLLCVKGRFILADLIHHPDRLHEPVFRFEEGEGIVCWDEALDKAKTTLEQHRQEQSLFFLSPDLRSEDLLAIAQFAQNHFPGAAISSSVLTPALTEYLLLAKHGITAEALAQSDCLVTFLLNGNYGYAPTTLAIKQTAAKGIPYYQIGHIRDTTSRYAKRQIPLTPDKLMTFLLHLEGALSKSTGDTDADALAAALQTAKRPVLIIGQEICDFTQASELLAQVQVLIGKLPLQVHCPLGNANLPALLNLPEIKSKAEAEAMINRGEVKNLIMVGTTLAPKTCLPLSCWSSVLSARQKN